MIYELNSKIDEYIDEIDMLVSVEASHKDIAFTANEYLKNIQESIYADTALPALLGVYNHIIKLEKKIKQADATIDKLKQYLKEYEDEFGISSAQEKRNKKLQREYAQMAYQELCELGAFDDDI